MVFTTRTLCRGNFTEMLHCLCFSFRCRFCAEKQGCVVLCFMARLSFKQRPKAATYLCRFAAKARFDNRLKPQGKVSKGEGSQPLPFGRFKGKGSLRKGGNRNPPFLKWRSLVTFFRQGKKVTRRRQKKRFGTDRAVRPYTRLPKTHALFIRADVGIRPYEITGKPVRHPFGAMRSSRPTKRAADECP